VRTPILIVGGGPAGLAAATALSSVGCPNVLVEKMDQLGGAPILSRYAKLVPSGEWAEDAIGGMVARVANNGTTDIRLNTVVQTFEGEAGRFTATLSDGSVIMASSVILATGFTHFDSINKPEWGFGTFPDVVTTTSFPITRQATWMADSAMTGLTLPGMIEEPGCVAGSDSSNMLHLGPDPSKRMSLAILESETAIVFSSPWASTNESLAA